MCSVKTLIIRKVKKYSFFRLPAIQPEMVTHEIGHLVGFWHEHARWDRDNNVIIMWNNVRARAIHNFDKVPRMRLLAPYDLSSMMHYSMKVGVVGQRVSANN